MRVKAWKVQDTGSDPPDMIYIVFGHRRLLNIPQATNWRTQILLEVLLKVTSTER